VITDDGTRKDANEVLLKDGPLALRKFIENSKEYPIEGLYASSAFSDKIWELYDNRNYEKPVSTGWRCLDEFYKVVPGELTVVTGMRLAAGYAPQHVSELAESMWSATFWSRLHLCRTRTQGWQHSAEHVHKSGKCCRCAQYRQVRGDRCAGPQLGPEPLLAYLLCFVRETPSLPFQGLG
jgi:hypothetical protein